MRVFHNVEEILAAVGEQLGTSEWVEITQERVNTFADATDDLLAQGGTRLDLAEALVHAGRTGDATVLVEEALARFDRKGATLPASNARERFVDLLAERVERGAASRSG